MSAPPTPPPGGEERVETAWPPPATNASGTPAATEEAVAAGTVAIQCVSALVCVVGNALVIFVILRYAR